MTWTQHKQTNTRRTWWGAGPYVIQALASGDYEAWCGAEWLGISGLLGGAKNMCALHAGPVPATNPDDDYKGEALMNRTELIAYLQDHMGDATQAEAARMLELLDDAGYVTRDSSGLASVDVSDIPSRAWMQMLALAITRGDLINA